MFYSHEILTSPEHGVATVWLAATLGPKSTTRKINRKAIFDVNVPGACRVITNPEVPMALRLQGSMLYGVSRVFYQQCGYTLLDAQSMRDKMASMLRLLPGSDLDPNAGKAKPSSLILPYDPTFLPETGLPGLNFDFSLFNCADDASTQGSSLWGKSAGSQSTFLQGNSKIQVEFPMEDVGTGNIVAGFEDDIFGSAVNRGLFGRTSPVAKGGEEGILLQPDFEFDEDGNIVEFHSSRLSPRKRRKIASMPRLSEDTPSGSLHRKERQQLIFKQIKIVQMNQEEDPFRDEVMMDLDLNPNAAQTTNIPELEGQAPKNHQNQVEQEADITHDPTEIFRAPSRKRPLREIALDEKTTLRNADLARSNEEYLVNMAQATKQKKYNRLHTIAKKNAAFWVYGQGLGSVDCISRSGAWDYAQTPQDERGTEDEQDHARALPREARAQDRGMNAYVDQLEDVEFARHAPSSILDDASSQMPWNISASLHSSGQAQRFGSRSMSIGDPRFESNTRAGVGVGVGGRYRITSASPLAGRSHLDPSHFDTAGGYIDDELEITRYLENELALDRENVSMLSNPNTQSRLRKTRNSLGEQLQYLRKNHRYLASLDRESLNFYEFIRENISAAAPVLELEDDDDERSGSVMFGDILPPSQTTRVVATQAFMNVLTLATEGWLVVRQDRLSDGGGDGWGARYRSGGIFMRVVEGDGASATQEV
ncbi:hypothetical protein N7481_010464 [Penicillium waksmanii]|uniref:uncharacterized protein n=1 Tax=Penicillium waksmanii TaxID=69791 RepID=UPI0025488C7A|nr:uncharacterized protein N7481_010464 [Penicillium waksmanii]KAJ5973254.1 hypothetical protein N7481_010464 [Penicillium waksmanii]